MINEEMNCRVEKPNNCKVLGMNKWGRGFQVNKGPNNSQYYQNGLQIYRPEDGLTVYQRREFLTPEFFDGGCFDTYCPQKKVCPNGKLAGETPQEKDMFDYFFQSTDEFFVNGGPINCAGIQADTANSYLGWAVPPGSNKPIWMIKAEKSGTPGACPGQ